MEGDREDKDFWGDGQKGEWVPMTVLGFKFGMCVVYRTSKLHSLKGL